jgi:hypothetical protein
VAYFKALSQLSSVAIKLQREKCQSHYFCLHLLRPKVVRRPGCCLMLLSSSHSFTVELLQTVMDTRVSA